MRDFRAEQRRRKRQDVRETIGSVLVAFVLVMGGLWAYSRVDPALSAPPTQTEMATR